MLDFSFVMINDNIFYYMIQRILCIVTDHVKITRQKVVLMVEDMSRDKKGALNVRFL